MNWIKGTREFISECGNYKIKNEGRIVGGNQYVLWEKHNRLPKENCFCVMLKMGTIQECKEAKL